MQSGTGETSPGVSILTDVLMQNSCMQSVGGNIVEVPLAKFQFVVAVCDR